MKWFWLALAVPVIEVFSIAGVAQIVGGGITMILIVMAMAMGLLVIRAGVRRLRVAASASDGARTSPSAADRSRRVDPITWTEPLVMIAAGVLLVIPGFVGDVVALALLIPGIRLLLLGLIGTRLARRFPSANVTLTRLRLGGGGPVIRGETSDPPQP